MGRNALQLLIFKKSSSIFLLFFLQLLLLFFIGQTNGYITIEDEKVSLINWKVIQPFPVNETLELVANNDDNYNLTGKLVYLDFPLYPNQVFIVPFMNLLPALKERGAIGVITCQLYGRRDSGLYAYKIPNDDIVLTTGFITRSTYDIFMKSGKMANITFFSWDENQWATIYSNPWFILYRILLCLMFVFNSIICAYKIIQWRLKTGRFKAIGLICLCVEFAANVIRAIQGVIFPSIPIYPQVGMDSTLTIPGCLTLITGILVIFFWFDLTIDPFFHKSGKCLGLMKIPSIIVIALLLIMEILFNIIRNLVEFDVLNTVMGFYILVHCLISVFYFVAAYRILNVSKTSHIKKKLRIITIRIVWSGVATFASGISILLLISNLTYYPLPYVVVWFISSISFFFQSFFLISIFYPPKPKKIPNPSSSSNSPKFEMTHVPVQNLDSGGVSS